MSNSNYTNLLKLSLGNFLELQQTKQKAAKWQLGQMTTLKNLHSYSTVLCSYMPFCSCSYSQPATNMMVNLTSYQSLYDLTNLFGCSLKLVLVLTNALVCNLKSILKICFATLYVQYVHTSNQMRTRKILIVSFIYCS